MVFLLGLFNDLIIHMDVIPLTLFMRLFPLKALKALEKLFWPCLPPPSNCVFLMWNLSMLREFLNSALIHPHALLGLFDRIIKKGSDTRDAANRWSTCRHRHHAHYFQPGKWQIYIGFFTLYRTALYFYSSMMLPDKSVSHGEVQSIALCLCGEEGL